MIQNQAGLAKSDMKESQAKETLVWQSIDQLGRF